MQPENAIEVRNIVKTFKVYLDKGHTLKELTLFSKRRKYEERRVLNGLSFDVKRGEAVGLIGQNGCGKSTTLKLLTRIMYPDSGTIEMKGRVSSLIELGAGFHPDMSGRQNIYTNASIFGLTRKEIDARVNNIITFSELEEFIDNPVRTYSSGMYMRLAFAVAINVDADILLIDEILAVGDASFQAKCFNKLREIKARGTTIVIVSHSLGQIEQMCERSIWIRNGKIQKEGPPREVHPSYLDYMGIKQIPRAGDVQEVAEAKSHIKESGNNDIKIVKAILLDEKGRPTTSVAVGSKIELFVEYIQQNIDIKKSEFEFHIYRCDGLECYGSSTLIDKVGSIAIQKQGTISIFFDDVSLLQGNYNIDLSFQSETGLNYHHVYNAVSFEICNQYDENGIFRLSHRWG